MPSGIYVRSQEHNKNISKALKSRGVHPPTEFQLKSGWKAPIGEKHPRWKGGRWKASGGYINRRIYPDDFFYSMANKVGYVAEHRLVMAQHLNRCLLPWEIVHHKNGIRDDNRIENLQLLPTVKYHIADTALKKHVWLLGKRITLLEAENELLRVQIESLSRIKG